MCLEQLTRTMTWQWTIMGQLLAIFVHCHSLHFLKDPLLMWFIDWRSNFIRPTTSGHICICHKKKAEKTYLSCLPLCYLSIFFGPYSFACLAIFHDDLACVRPTRFLLFTHAYMAGVPFLAFRGHNIFAPPEWLRRLFYNFHRRRPHHKPPSPPSFKCPGLTLAHSNTS